MHEARTHGAPEFPLKIQELDEALHLALHGIHSCYQWHHMCIRVHSTLASRANDPSAHAKSTHLRTPRMTHWRTPQAYIRTRQANGGWGWGGWGGVGVHVPLHTPALHPDHAWGEVGVEVRGVITFMFPCTPRFVTYLILLLLTSGPAKKSKVHLHQGHSCHLSKQNIFWHVDTLT